MKQITMKNSLLFIFLSVAFFGSAQSLTEATEPAIGEMRSMYLCDSFTVTYPGTTGAGITWDYTGLTGFTGEMRDITVLDATTAPNAANFPGAVKAIQFSDRLTTYYSTDATKKISQGFVFVENTIGDILVMLSTDQELLVNYPFLNGDVLNDSFTGLLEFDFSGPQQSAVTGVVKATIDGEGTLNLPGGVSLPNVLRYKIVDTSASTLVALGPLEIIRTQYEYFAPSLAPEYLPVLTFTEINIIQPGGTTPVFPPVKLVLSAYEPNYLDVAEINSNSISVYPTPTSESIHIKGLQELSAVARFIDQSGRIIISQKISNGGSIDISHLEKGIYILSIDQNGSTYTKRIVRN